jgi:hypothetical protein
VAGVIAESKLKELHPSMPVMYIKAVTKDTSVRIVLLLQTHLNNFCEILSSGQNGCEEPV